MLGIKKKSRSKNFTAKYFYRCVQYNETQKNKISNIIPDKTSNKKFKLCNNITKRLAIDYLGEVISEILDEKLNELS